MNHKGAAPTWITNDAQGAASEKARQRPPSSSSSWMSSSPREAVTRGRRGSSIRRRFRVFTGRHHLAQGYQMKSKLAGPQTCASHWPPVQSSTASNDPHALFAKELPKTRKETHWRFPDGKKMSTSLWSRTRSCKHYARCAGLGVKLRCTR